MVDLNLYKEEVRELTELFRSEWKDIQRVAVENGLSVENTFLLSFIEIDEGGEVCLFYDIEKGLFLYDNENGMQSFKMVELDEMKKEFPQVATVADISNFSKWGK